MLNNLEWSGDKAMYMYVIRMEEDEMAVCESKGMILTFLLYR